MITLKSLNTAREKGFEFSNKVIKLYLVMHDKREFILSKYLVRSGTSIGAHLEVATIAHSKNEYISNVNIAHKDAKRTHYWLLLMRNAEIIDSAEAKDLLDDVEELLSLISDIIMALNTEEKAKPIASSSSNNFEWLKNHKY